MLEDQHQTELEREILDSAKDWFRNVIAKNHISNTVKCADVNEFQINPFLVSYLASFLTGNDKPESIAKALVYPRVLGTSITTSFGMNMQEFIPYLKSALGNQAVPSIGSGMDIEFMDHIDGNRKYCQMKAGPRTINKEDIATIHGHFSSLKRLARTNGLKLNDDQLVVGVLYGDRRELSANYKTLERKHFYSVFVGQEFWHRLTGDERFYFKLGQAISSVAIEFDGTKTLEETIYSLADSQTIRKLSSETSDEI